jgi:hypothetical protein
MCNEVKLAFIGALARGARIAGKMAFGTKMGRTATSVGAFTLGPGMAKGLKNLAHGRSGGLLINSSLPDLAMDTYKSPRPIDLGYVTDKAQTVFNANFSM